MRIGLFGGSFDPIHWGHLLHAQDALELAGLDRIALMPAAQAPLKITGPTAANAQQRLEMLNLAIGGREEFMVLADEIDRGGVSYTIDTIRRLKQRWPNDELFLIIGADQVEQLCQWREIEHLSQLVSFICLRRPGYQEVTPPGIDSSSLRWISGRHLDISSTEIRDRARSGLPLDFFLPPAVASFIRNNELYR